MKIKKEVIVIRDYGKGDSKSVNNKQIKSEKYANQPIIQTFKVIPRLRNNDNVE